MSEVAAEPERTPTVFKMPVRHDRIGPLTDVNVLGLQWLIECARQPSIESNAFVESNRTLLKAITDARLPAIAARLPVMMFDFHFQDGAWWTRQTQRHTNSAHASPSVPTGPATSALLGLARSALILAWHTARTDLDAAHVMLGLSPTVAHVFAQLHLPTIDAIAAVHHQDVTPRWPRNCTLWKSILSRAKGKNAVPEHILALQCLSLAAGEILLAS